MSERLTDAEADDLERYCRKEAEALAAWEANPTPALWPAVEDAREAISIYVDAEDIRKLLAERRELRAALLATEYYLPSAGSCPPSHKLPITKETVRALLGREGGGA